MFEEAPDSMLVALGQHDEAIDEAVLANGGLLVRPRGEGDSRFIVFENARNAVVGAAAMQSRLAAVDWVVPFSDDTPAALIAAVLPDVLVKGGDYEPDEIAGGKDVLRNGGEVRVLSFRDGHSTSRIIEKLRA